LAGDAEGLDVGEGGVGELADDDVFLCFFEGRAGEGVGADVFDGVVEFFF